MTDTDIIDEIERLYGQWLRREINDEEFSAFVIDLLEERGKESK